MQGLRGAHIGTCASTPLDLHLIVADENLDFQDDTTGDRATISGSCAIAELLEDLQGNGGERDPPGGGQGNDGGGSLANRCLALVRSANDSGEDIALYHSRAHGFVPKMPVRRGKVKELLARLWHMRFGPPTDLRTSQEHDTRAEGSRRDAPDGAAAATSSGMGPPSPQDRIEMMSGEDAVAAALGSVATIGKRGRETASRVAADRGCGDDAAAAAPKRARQSTKRSSSRNGSSSTSSVPPWFTEAIDASLVVINRLCEGGVKDSEWPQVWEALHRLKGDLKCYSDARAVRAAIAHIEAMRAPSVPHDFERRWETVRSFISTLILAGPS